MKGMMSLLERAGLVRKEDEEGPIDAVLDTVASTAPRPVDDNAAPAAPVAPVDESSSMTLQQVYSAAGVPASSYPAERLLRLLDGLKAMDEGIRRQAIQAMDAADESWSIDDPVRDAVAKVAAIESHAGNLRAGVAQAEQEAQSALATAGQRQESTVAEIKRQVTELEGLMAREIARGAHESAELEAVLRSRKEAATRELGNLGRAADELRQLVAQFNVATK